MGKVCSLDRLAHDRLGDHHLFVLGDLEPRQHHRWSRGKRRGETGPPAGPQAERGRDPSERSNSRGEHGRPVNEESTANNVRTNNERGCGQGAT